MTRQVGDAVPIRFQLTLAGAVQPQRLEEFRAAMAQVMVGTTTFQVAVSAAQGANAVRRLLGQHGLVALGTRQVDTGGVIAD